MPKHIFKEEEPKIDILPNLGDSLFCVAVVVVVDVVAAVVVVEKAVANRVQETRDLLLIFVKVEFFAFRCNNNKITSLPVPDCPLRAEIRYTYNPGLW